MIRRSWRNAVLVCVVVLSIFSLATIFHGDHKTHGIWLRLSPLFEPSNVLPNPLRIAHVNVHWGVKSEIDSIMQLLAQRLNIIIKITNIKGIWNHPNFTNPAVANQWYAANRDMCEGKHYDFVLVGEPTVLGRPFLQAAQYRLLILFVVPNRIDVYSQSDQSYIDLMQQASNWPHVLLAANNRYEEWHNNAILNMNVSMPYISASDIPSLDAKAIYTSSVQRNIVPPVGSQDTVLYTVVLTGRNAHANGVIRALEQLQVPLRKLPHTHFGSPLALSNKILLHIPYQCNTMSFFENLSMNVTYVLLTIRLLKHYMSTGMAVGDMYGDCSFFAWLGMDDNQYAQVIDWYRSDLKHMFFYFDHTEDLMPNSSFMQMLPREAPKKRRLIHEFMKVHTETVVKSWVSLFAHFSTVLQNGRRFDQHKCVLAES
jgi:hypothetical protein